MRQREFCNVMSVPFVRQVSEGKNYDNSDDNSIDNRTRLPEMAATGISLRFTLSSGSLEETSVSTEIFSHLY